MNRRLFLRGLGGAMVAAPFLGSVAERAVNKAGAAAVATQKRMIVMFTHYGCLTDRWFPASADGPLTEGDFKGLSIEPLGPFAKKLLMPRGIRAMNEWNEKLVRGQGNDPHGQVVGSYFTCAPVTPNSNDPFSLTTGTRFNPKPVAPSLDHVCAKQLSPAGTPMYLTPGGTSESWQAAISYSAAETQYRGLSLSQAYKSVTGLAFGSAPGMSADSYQVLRGKSVLDLVRDDLETLQRIDMSKSDRAKLEAWKALLDDTGKAVHSLQCSPELAASLGLSDANVQATSGIGVDISTLLEGSVRDTSDMYSNVAVLAAACNTNPVIFINYPGAYVFKGLGLTVENHGLSHRIGNANMGGTCLPGVNEMLQKVDAFYARKFAYLIGTLDSLTEGEGTLLDNTATVWFQEMSDGMAHNLNNLPIIQAGSCGGYFKTGQAVNVDGRDPMLLRGTSSVLCEKEEAKFSFEERTAAGTDPKYGNAPINKYFCNLMNAIGVKAGADGFPAVGGTQEVTRYGMYDKTEDFVGGGTNPPTIHSPEGFKELRANA